MKKLIILSLLSFLFFACDKQEEKNSNLDIGSNPTLSKNEVIDMVKATKENFRLEQKSNYHLGYPDVLNDSTFILQIAVNNNIPYKDENVTNYMIYKEDKIFVYNRSRLRFSLDTINKEMLSINKQDSPFFIPDSKSISLLVEKRNGDLILSKVEPLLTKRNNVKDTLNTDF